MNRIYVIILVLGIIGSYHQAFSSPIDSLRLETIDGKSYIIHQVDPGETLYSISKRYQCTMNAIAEASPEVKRGLANGMTIRVPYNSSKKPAVAGEKIHIVKQGETLYSISRIYDISVIDIMEWNDLMSADLEIDQKLKIIGETSKAPVDYVLDGMRIHVVQPGEGLYAIARQYDVSVDELVTLNELTSSALNLGQEIIVERLQEEPKPEPPDTSRVIVNQPVPIVEEIDQAEPDIDSLSIQTDEPDNFVNKPPIKMMQGSESGLAAAIEGEANGTYLAMHRTIPVGNLVAVRNEMNNQVVFVRIIGVLPDTGINNKVIIRLSPSAVEQLRAIDPKFRVEITYLVPEE